MSTAATRRGHIGLYGKLPSKRDFVSLGLPRTIVEPWERWLQSGVAHARDALGTEWEDAYLTAPIWNFWVGERVLDHALQGAIVPSVDRVGRMFPLAVAYAFPKGESIEAPVVTVDAAWFRQVGAALMLCLEEDEIRIDDLLSRLEPPSGAVGASGDALTFAGEGHACAGALLRDNAPYDHAQASARRSYWWTDGREGEGPCVHMSDGLPRPDFFAFMLTGDGHE